MRQVTSISIPESHIQVLNRMSEANKISRSEVVCLLIEAHANQDLVKLNWRTWDFVEHNPKREY